MGVCLSPIGPVSSTGKRKGVPNPADTFGHARDLLTFFRGDPDGISAKLVGLFPRVDNEFKRSKLDKVNSPVLQVYGVNKAMGQFFSG